MNTSKVLAIAGSLVMLLTLIYGFIEGDFFKEGSILIALAWGKVSLIDVYTGFFLFSGWVIFREKKFLIAVSWILAILVLGNLISCLYVCITLFKSKEDYKHFWLGKYSELNS